MSPESQTTHPIDAATALVPVQDRIALIKRRRKSALKAMSKGDLIRLITAMDPFVVEYQEWVKHYAQHGTDFGEWLARTHGTAALEAFQD